LLIGFPAAAGKWREEMDAPILVYTTYPSLVEAETAGRGLLAAGLAACVNIVPEMVSIFRWKGQVERGAEVIMIVDAIEPAGAGRRHGARKPSV
jgi:uncharacterized protein involved in tolerance to divalent cations